MPIPLLRETQLPTLPQHYKVAKAMKLELIMRMGFCSVCLFVVGCAGGFVDFQPIKLQEGRENKLLPAPELLTPDFVSRVKVVLEFYGDQYQTNSTGGLQITARLARDKERLWNYTTKAQDNDFIKQALAFKLSPVQNKAPDNPPVVR